MCHYTLFLNHFTSMFIYNLACPLFVSFGLAFVQNLCAFILSLYCAFIFKIIGKCVIILSYDLLLISCRKSMNIEENVGVCLVMIGLLFH